LLPTKQNQKTSAQTRVYTPKITTQ